MAIETIHDAMMYHQAMQEKYELAAQRPWQLVSADPPVVPIPSSGYQREFRRKFIDPLLIDD
ncbi:hypothetical protein ACYOEI_03260 [Singulisphaera rosea]